MYQTKFVLNLPLVKISNQFFAPLIGFSMLSKELARDSKLRNRHMWQQLIKFKAIFKSIALICENIGVTDGSNDLNPIGYDGNRKNKEDENKTQPHVFVFQVTM